MGAFEAILKIGMQKLREPIKETKISLSEAKRKYTPDQAMELYNKAVSGSRVEKIGNDRYLIIDQDDDGYDLESTNKISGAQLVAELDNLDLDGITLDEAKVNENTACYQIHYSDMDVIQSFLEELKETTTDVNVLEKIDNILTILAAANLNESGIKEKDSFSKYWEFRTKTAEFLGRLDSLAENRLKLSAEEICSKLKELVSNFSEDIKESKIEEMKAKDAKHALISLIWKEQDTNKLKNVFKALGAENDFQIDEKRLNEEGEEEQTPSEKVPQEAPVEEEPSSVAPKDAAPSDEVNKTADEPNVLEKEPLGQKGQDVFYYLKRVFNDDGSVKELVLTDSSEKQIFTSEEVGLKPDQIADFVLKANEKEGLTLINTDIVKKYFTHVEEPQQEVPNEEQPQEELVPKDEVAIEAPENASNVPEEITPGVVPGSNKI